MISRDSCHATPICSFCQVNWNPSHLPPTAPSHDLWYLHWWLQAIRWETAVDMSSMKIWNGSVHSLIMMHIKHSSPYFKLKWHILPQYQASVYHTMSHTKWPSYGKIAHNICSICHNLECKYVVYGNLWLWLQCRPVIPSGIYLFHWDINPDMLLDVATMEHKPMFINGW